MNNSVRLKTLKCVEWNVTMPSRLGDTHVSKPFLLQDCECHLECTVGSYISYSNYKFHLHFKSYSFIGLQFPISVTVRVSTVSEILKSETKAIIRPNQELWSASNCDLRGCLLTFEVIFHASYSEDHKSVQVSSNKETCCLVECLSHDFGKLFDESPHHDVEFTCGDQTLKAHKSILCCRSNVFASMLQSDMIEGKTGRINIEDIDATIFQQFLRCLYTGMLPELTLDSAFQFYEVSDKYGVESVKKQCASFLTDNLSLENACEFLVLSDRHGDVDFKRNVIQYVIKEKMPYMGEKWANFCKENSMLAVEVYEQFCEQFRPK